MYMWFTEQLEEPNVLFFLYEELALPYYSKSMLARSPSSANQLIQLSMH